jgi:hypothetical protein
MHALTLCSVFWELDELMQVGLQAGVLVTAAGSVQVAQDVLQRNHIDILIIDARVVGPHLSYFLDPRHSKNKSLVCVLRSDHVPQDQEDLPRLYPSLHAIVDRALPTAVALQMVLSSFRRAHVDAFVRAQAGADLRHGPGVEQAQLMDLPPLPLAS